MALDKIIAFSAMLQQCKEETSREKSTKVSELTSPRARSSPPGPSCTPRDEPLTKSTFLLPFSIHSNKFRDETTPQIEKFREIHDFDDFGRTTSLPMTDDHGFRSAKGQSRTRAWGPSAHEQKHYGAIPLGCHLLD